jgi:hypothetical protein
MARNGSEFPRIRNILMDGAQLYNRLQVSLGSGNIKFKDVVPLKPEAAIMLGCEFVSESVVFGIGFAFVYYEYEQSQIKEAAKEAARAKTVHDLKAQIVALTACISLSFISVFESLRVFYMQERVDALAPVTAVDVQVEAPKP